MSFVSNYETETPPSIAQRSEKVLLHRGQLLLAGWAAEGVYISKATNTGIWLVGWLPHNMAQAFDGPLPPHVLFLSFFFPRNYVRQRMLPAHDILGGTYLHGHVFSADGACDFFIALCILVGYPWRRVCNSENVQRYCLPVAHFGSKCWWHCLLKRAPNSVLSNHEIVSTTRKA